MNFLEITGCITLGAIAVFLLWVAYHIVRGFVLSCDFILWQYSTTKRNDPDLKFSIGIFLGGVVKNWVDMIGYTPDSFSCEMKGSVWQGFGSWRQK